MHSPVQVCQRSKQLNSERQQFRMEFVQEVLFSTWRSICGAV